MKRLVLSLVVFLFLIQLVSAEVRINEVMAHNNNDFGFEWVELYNSENTDVSLINWILGDLFSNDTINLNLSSKGFALIINAETDNCSLFDVPNESCIGLAEIGRGLNDDSEKLSLYNGSGFLIQDVSWNKIIKSSGNSLQFCSNDWIENPPTPGLENDCEEDKNPDPVNNNEDTYIELEWDEEDIINGEEFQIKVKAYYLDNEIYDIKVWIEDDDEVVISEIYDENSEWVISSQYYNEFFDDPDENESKKIKLRIKTKYDNFKGDAKILAKLRLSEDEDVVDSFEEDIEILEKEEDVVDNKDDSKDDDDNNDKDTSVKLISLGNKDNVSKTEDIKTKNNIVYQSKQEIIKKYAIYGFALFCVFLCILLAFEKLK